MLLWTLLIASGIIVYPNIGYNWARASRWLYENWENASSLQRFSCFPFSAIGSEHPNLYENQGMVLVDDLTMKQYYFVMAMLWPIKLCWTAPIILGYGFYRGVLCLLKLKPEYLFIWPSKLFSWGWKAIVAWRRERAGRRKALYRAPELEHQLQQLLIERDGLDVEIQRLQQELRAKELQKAELDGRLELGTESPNSRDPQIIVPASTD